MYRVCTCFSKYCLSPCGVVKIVQNVCLTLLDSELNKIYEDVQCKKIRKGGEFCCQPSRLKCFKIRWPFQTQLYGWNKLRLEFSLEKKVSNKIVCFFLTITINGLNEQHY